MKFMGLAKNISLLTIFSVFSINFALANSMESVIIAEYSKTYNVTLEEAERRID